ncbi:hypothetical protein AYI69_g1932 [Smittium culicis]|uniref:Uncharacterized protein n=1 Tax=Smittium culicis TaxID=133412 RepID=A0A1R1YNU8_9FUNG|nr:hypothetical protein AYI69_g1932 [Smittium culicis]
MGVRGMYTPKKSIRSITPKFVFIVLIICMFIYTFYKTSPNLDTEKNVPINNDAVIVDDQANIYNENVNQKNKAFDSNNEMEQQVINIDDQSEIFEDFGIHPTVVHLSSQSTVDSQSKNSDILQELKPSRTQTVNDIYRSEETKLKTNSRSESSFSDSNSQDSLLKTVVGDGIFTDSNFSEPRLFSQVSSDNISEIQSEKVSSGSIYTDNNIFESHTDALENIKSESFNQPPSISSQNEKIETASTTVKVINSGSSDDEEESMLAIDIYKASSDKDYELIDSLPDHENDEKSNFDKGNQDSTINYNDDENENKVDILQSLPDQPIDESIKTTEFDNTVPSSQKNDNDQLPDTKDIDIHLDTHAVKGEKNEDDLASNTDSSEYKNFDSDDDDDNDGDNVAIDKANMENADSPKETLNKPVFDDDFNEIDLAPDSQNDLESDPDLFIVSEKINNDSEDDE